MESTQFHSELPKKPPNEVIGVDALVTALVFPGQGTQRNGMARDFCDASAEAAAVFEQASDALGLDVAAVCWNDDERLWLTEFAQPAILTAEIAMLRALETRFDFQPQRFAGHSLGEYAALVAAGVITIGDAAVLVRERGRLMQEAVPVGAGSMLAVIQPGLNMQALGTALAGGNVDIANLNCRDQVVLSGPSKEVAAVAGWLRDIEGCERARCIPLKVSAPFHSRLMQPAAERFAPVLAAARDAWDATGAGRVASNYSGRFHEADGESVAAGLAAQITAPVRWLDNMEALLGCTERIIELGPGRPLRGFFASMNARIDSISTFEAAAEVLG